MVGINLVPLIDPKQNGPLLKRMKRVRSQLLFEYGLNIKGVRVMDNLDLGSHSYSIIIDQEVLAEGEICPKCSFYPFPKTNLTALNVSGKVVTNPISGDEGVWVSDSDVKVLQKNGYDALSIIDTISFHFLVVVKRYFLFKGRCQQFQLSDRECEVVKGVIEGKANPEIATTLFISESTVKQHLQNIFQKANIKSRYGLMKLF